MQVKDVIVETETRMKKSLESVRREFMEVRTGRAHPGLIEGMHIDYYGTPTMIKQIAAISVPDPKTVVIQPWDMSAIPEIEKAVLNSKLGVSPVTDGKLIRLHIPPLSKERRQELMKVVKDMAEHGRISLRTIRRDANEKVKKLQSDGVLTEDNSFRSQEEIQKLTDRYIKDVDKILEDKNHELSDMNA
ncbi:MAG: ribosome recycling factor [Candidatus Omnitrophota bacterium]|nr:ribosome recycling factor [Candidatus Omnitrophota bacterium]MDZ4241663.1 ribosome recycling factor [Candidatus Omnitrophota bacterium]